MVNLYFVLLQFSSALDEDADSEQDDKLDILRKVSKVMAEEELSEVFYKKGDLMLRIKRGVVVEPLASSQQIQRPQEDDVQEKETQFEIIRAPRPGTFYRAPAQDEPYFVEIGVKVAKGDILCSIEAMKFYNKIHAEFPCEIVEIIAKNAQPVQFDDPLFRVKRHTSH